MTENEMEVEEQEIYRRVQIERARMRPIVTNSGGSGPAGPTSSVGVPGPTGPVADPVYDFEHLGVRLAESVVLAAKAKVDEANTLLAQAEAWADSIKSQVQIQTDALTSFNDRLKTFGTNMLEAHRKFNGDKHDNNDGS